MKYISKRQTTPYASSNTANFEAALKQGGKLAQVERQHRKTNIAAKRFTALPQTAGQTQGAEQTGQYPLNARTEALQYLEPLLALMCLPLWGAAARFGDGNIFNIVWLRAGQLFILLAVKATVAGKSTGAAAKLLNVLVQYSF